MAETLSPTRQRIPVATLIQSPTSPFFLGSNNDQLERAQARAARAAAIRRKSIAVNASHSHVDADTDPGLDKQQIFDLFQNCIKLASENKINQKNTWELNLIDHLTDIIKVEEENDVETNFQKASCTLEAGVKIYSLRVDSVHSEAYKVLGGMNRAGQESERDTTLEDDSGQEGEVSRKEIDKKMSPLSTLESSFEPLNVKKFDAAFSVDPLYHQTSAQFDEGGAKGLLMNNLSVYGGCRVLFDSLEVPGKCMTSEHQHDKSDMIDLSFARECVEEMVWNIRMKNEISPTLQSIVNQFDEDNRRLSSFDFSDQKSGEQFDAVCPDGIRFDGDGYGNCTAWDNDDDEQISVVDVGLIGADSSFPCYPQENDPVSFHDPYMDDSFENVDEYLFLSLGFTSKQNAWAGPDHWKYQKAKVSEVHSATENGSPTTAKRPRNKKQAEIDINFTKALEKTMLDIFCPPKNPKTLLLPENRPHCNTKLPEDCHYQPEDLVKLFLLPNVKCLGKKRGVFSDETREQCNEYGSFPSWDDGSVCGGDYGDRDIHDAEEDSSTLVSQPRQVNKIDVQYDKTSKQVDVQALKITLWDHIQESHQSSAQGQGEMTSFSQILANFPSDCSAAPTINDISPHLCFICLLHLANEHGLSIHNCTNLDDLSIYLPHIGIDISGTI